MPAILTSSASDPATIFFMILPKEMRFQYTGWLRAQKLIPVTNLKVGTNDMIITSGSATSTSAIRGTQVQLKYLWEKSDYLLQADH